MVFISGVWWKLLNSVPGRCGFTRGRFERMGAAADGLGQCCCSTSIVFAVWRRRGVIAASLRWCAALLHGCIAAWLRSHLFHRLKPAPQFVIDRTDDVVDEHYEPQPLVEHVTVGTGSTTEYD